MERKDDKFIYLCLALISLAILGLSLITFSISAKLDKVIEQTKNTETETVQEAEIPENIAAAAASFAAADFCWLDVSPRYHYMDYRKITCKCSDQYALQYCGNVYTFDDGIRAYFNSDNKEWYILVALGEYFGTDIGDTWSVTLDNGNTFNIMLGDCKSKVYYGHETEKGVNMIEFIVDTRYLDKDVKTSGSLSSYDYFNGEIEEITYLGRVWEPDLTN